MGEDSRLHSAEMIHVRALVVGIDRYAQPTWDVSGPVTAALAVTRWLLHLRDVELMLDVFLDEDAILDEGLSTAAAQNRFVLHRTTRRDEIDSFVRVKLSESAAVGTHLFVFWSGHGVTCEATDDRIFVCGDYCDRLPDRVFNAGNFLRMLRTATYSAYSSQLLLADVCGVYRCQRFIAHEHHKQTKRPQLAFFATPSGEYAKSATSGGVFTETALKVFRALERYPFDLAQLDQRLDEAFRAAGTDSFKVSVMSSARQAGDSQDQADAEDSGDILFDSAFALLAAHDVVESVYRRHYERTVADLEMPALLPARGLKSVLAELCALRDGEHGNMSYGLMQFMMRLAERAELKDAITRWLDWHAKYQPNSRKEIASMLTLEKSQRMLLLEVLLDGSGTDIGGVKAYLCCADGSFDRARKFEPLSCSGWDSFVGAVQLIISDLAGDFLLENMQVQFIVDSPLLDRPFHRIPVSPEGPPIGVTTSVVLRHRQRLMYFNPGMRKKWTEYADKLRSVPVKKLKWHKIECATHIEAKEDMCFAGFVVPHPGAGAGSCKEEKAILHRVLMLGVPVLYVRHALPTKGQWAGVGRALKKLTAELTNLEGFVGSFHDARLRGDANAEEASLIWDDPSFNPFTSDRGVNDGTTS
ncbi:hypothetical protein QF001_008058 [Paraburkholderia youngii]|uniref:VMAP-C domain-containing protein n=1 Tax=Paraburkholderia youngii TaxID=2782701 RepID=UPI003D1AA7ED